jgi:hypothetical protein
MCSFQLDGLDRRCEALFSTSFLDTLFLFFMGERQNVVHRTAFCPI